MPPSPLRTASPVRPQAPPPAPRRPAASPAQALAPSTVPAESVADLARSRFAAFAPWLPDARALEAAGPDEVAAYFRAVHVLHGAITTILLSFF